MELPAANILNAPQELVHFTSNPLVIVSETSGPSTSPPNEEINVIQKVLLYHRTCPPGLEYMSLIDQLWITQTAETLCVLTGYGDVNKYVIKNVMEQVVYYGMEKFDDCTRNYCSPRRNLTLKIFDRFNLPIISIKKRFAFQSCLVPCRLRKVEVCGLSGATIGYVEQNWNPLYPAFIVKDSTDEPMISIKGPLWMSGCWRRKVNFQIKSVNGGLAMGNIYKQLSNTDEDGFTEADSLVVVFPMDLQVCLKATLLGAAFLINFMYFENTGNKLRVQGANE